MDLFKKKPKARNPKKYIDESKLDEYTDEEITKFIQSVYKVGDKVNQSTAYNVSDEPDYHVIIKSNSVSIERRDKSINISIGGCGVWNSRGTKKLAKIISK